ncbi:MAG: TonB-dependent receptor [Chitinophagaceae bacterium]|nr:MAG: TonB-dependent receptor [Chitinophagaceae bacterium]
MKLYLIIAIIFLAPFSLSAQVLKGKVVNETNQPLADALLHWLNTDIHATTDKQGEFEINIPAEGKKKLVVSFISYQSDTITLTTDTYVHIKMVPVNQLGEVVVKGVVPGQYISFLNPIKTEVITSAELKKGACCDLAGCFNTNASVQTATTNVVTNAQELRILGLSGVYNQVLLDGFPMIQGLSYTYGISDIPGPLIDNIYISKGANSLVQGYESISGQIDVETKEPDKANKLFLNGYMNTFLEKQFNGYYSYKKNRWGDLIAANMVQPASRFDKNNDGFLDLPLLTRYEVMNKLKFGNEQDFGFSFESGIRLINEQRIGGQINYDVNTDKGKSTAYGEYISYTQPEIWAKTAYRWDESKRMVLYASAFHQNQNSWFGLTNYKALQTTIDTRLQYEWNYKEKSNLKTGISFHYFNLDENISFTQNPLNHTYAGNYEKLEYVPGIFAENTLYFGQDKFTWIAGARLDHHNQFGFIFTPRTLLRYSPVKETSIRGSIGYGWRTANVFSENPSLLASQRDIVFMEPLKPERAVNFGINFTQGFSLTNIDGTFSADFYRTRFYNQIFPDYNTNPTKVYISNFTGKSISNAFQAEISLNFYKRFELNSSYNYLNVYRMQGKQKQLLPFIPADMILNALSYEPLTNKWHIDANIHWYGKQHLPNTSSNPPEYQRPAVSKPYTTVNAQFTYNFKKFEIYAGCENILDFRQKQPIISWQNPFDPYFDVSSVWGPTMGREGYIGIRFKLD